MRWLERNTVRPSEAKRLHQVADPQDSLGIEAVDRLVEHQRLGVADEGGGNAQTLVHAE